MPSRRLRRLCAALATGVALAAAPAAHAESYFLQSSSPSGAPDTFAQVQDVQDAMRLRITRAGQVIEDRAGELHSGAYSDVASDVDLVPGDRVEWFVPASTTVPGRVVIWDGRPTLESCPVGGNVVAGAQNAGTVFQSVFVERTGDRPYGVERFELATVTQSGEGWTGLFRRPLAARDVIDAVGFFRPDPSLSISRHLRVAAGTCANDPRDGGFLAFTGSDGALKKLAKRDVRQRKTTVRVRVACLAASKIPCRGRARLFRGKKAVATKKLSLKPGRSTLLKLKLSKREAKRLKRKHKLKVRVLAQSSDPAGKRLSRSRSLTLKRPKAKKKKR